MAAAVVAAAVISWQALTVHFNYGGKWSGLYCTGDQFPLPPSLAHEDPYVFRGTAGFDGQFYHYIAHDPFIQGDAWKSISAPRLRYRRILIPLAAYVLAGGRSEWVDPAFRLVVWTFFFLGAYWLARLAVVRGRSPAWGLAFVIVPGALISMDRMLPDIGIASLCAGFALLLATGRAGWRLYVLVLLAALIRDTGALLAASVAIWFATQRQWRRAALFSTALLPMLGWYLWVAARTPPYPHYGSLAWPLEGALSVLLTPIDYPYAPWLRRLLQTLDLFEIGGVILAFVLAVALICRRPRTAERWTMLSFVILAQLFWSWGDWAHTYNYPRVLSPLLFLLALEWLQSSWLPGLSRRWQRWGVREAAVAQTSVCGADTPVRATGCLDTSVQAAGVGACATRPRHIFILGCAPQGPLSLLPLLMVLPRIGLELSSQTIRIAKGLLGLPL